MLPIQVVMAPLADRGLCLHTYPHPEKNGPWVLHATTLHGDASVHMEVNGGALSQAFPPAGGKLIAEHYPDGRWGLKLLHDDALVREQIFDPNTNVMTALKEFFQPTLISALTPHLITLITKLGMA